MVIFFARRSLLPSYQGNANPPGNHCGTQQQRVGAGWSCPSPLAGEGTDLLSWTLLLLHTTWLPPPPDTGSVKAPCTFPNRGPGTRTPGMGLQHFFLPDTRGCCHVQICQCTGKKIAQKVLHQPWHTRALPCSPPTLSACLEIQRYFNFFAQLSNESGLPCWARP